MTVKRVSAADLGTNTLKVSHFEADPDGDLDVLGDSTETVRLGAGIESTGLIDPDRIDQAISFLKEQESQGRALGSETFIGVGTDAIRVASNGHEFLARVSTETSWHIRLISSELEARLTYVGLKHEVPDHGSALIVDIGGGSTEVIRVETGSVISSESLRLGSGRLADRYFHTDPPGIQSLLETTSAAQGVLKSDAELPDLISTLLFSGGNGIFIQELVHQLFPDEALGFGSIERLLQHLADTPAFDAASRLGISHERARVLPAGAAIALAFLSTFEAEHVRGVESGIRTGLVREYMDQG